MMQQRELIGELMDDPSLAEAEHRRALLGLRRINAVSRTAPTLFHQLVALFANEPSRPRRVLDVACGDGDNTLRLAQLASARGLPWEVSGCDLSERSVQFANELSEQRGIEARFFQADALNGLETRAYDAVVNSLFLHHLTDQAIVRFLQSCSGAAHVVISDLRRSRLAYAVTCVGVRVLSRSRVVHVDGPLSVRAALTCAELRGLLDQAGMTRATVRKTRPMRQTVVWSRPA